MQLESGNLSGVGKRMKKEQTLYRKAGCGQGGCAHSDGMAPTTTRTRNPSSTGGMGGGRKSQWEVSVSKQSQDRSIQEEEVAVASVCIN